MSIRRVRMLSEQYYARLFKSDEPLPPDPPQQPEPELPASWTRFIGEPHITRQRLPGSREILTLGKLPMARFLLWGPKKRLFCVRVGGVRGPVFDMEPEVRERILEEIRHDVYAMWSDPRERLGI